MPVDSLARARTLRDVIDSFGRWPDRPALLAFGAGGPERRTYGELRDMVGRLTGGLVEAGIGPGSHVAILAPNSGRWVAACLAAINAGAVAVPVDTQMDTDSLDHVLADCRPDIVFVTAETAARLRRLTARPPRIVLMDAEPPDRGDWHALLSDGAAPPPQLQPRDKAVMFYTSGTTGPPKGVPLDHRAILFQLAALERLRLMAPGERLLLPLPLHHVYPFVVGLLAGFVHGVGVVFPRSLTGPQILEALRDGRAATVIGVPRLYEAVVAAIEARARARGRLTAAAFAATLRLSIGLRRVFGVHAGRFLFRPVHAELGRQLRLVASGGAALSPTLAWKLEGLGWTVTAGYGLTETAPLLSLLPPGDTRFASTGRPLPGIDIRIAPPAPDPTPESGPPPVAGAPEIGEIQARGPSVFGGYHRLPDRTAEAFTDDGWFRTEDRGYLDDRGYLHVLGRTATLVVTPAGINIQLEELEESYRRNPLIREVGLLMGEQGLSAVVVPQSDEIQRSGTADPEQALAAAVRETSMALPPHKRVVDFVVSRESLARTRLGKIRRAALRRRYRSIRSGAVGAARSGPMPPDEMSAEDRALLEDAHARQVWDWLARRYPDRAVTPDASLLLDLGIDSLGWIDLTLKIQELTGTELTEEATARIESVRDLLNAVVAGAGEAPAPQRADPVREPERYLGARQKKWLAPLTPAERAGARLLYDLNRLVMRAVFDLTVEGLDRLPADARFVLTPNHQSTLDPFALAAALPYETLRRSAFAGWTGIAFANPLYRLACRLARAFPVEHERAAFSSLALGATVLRQGDNLIWFPEGARSPDGRLQPFKAGIGLLLLAYPRPVVPARITGTFEAMPRGRSLPRPYRVRVIFGEPLAAETLAERVADGKPDERIARVLHDAVASLGPADAS